MAKLQDKVAITQVFQESEKHQQNCLIKKAKLVLVDLDENKGNEAAKEIGGKRFSCADVTSEEDAKSI